MRRQAFLVVVALVFVLGVLGTLGAFGCATNPITEGERAIIARAARDCPSQLIVCDGEGMCACMPAGPP